MLLRLARRRLTPVAVAAAVTFAGLVGLAGLVGPGPASGAAADGAGSSVGALTQLEGIRGCITTDTVTTCAIGRRTTNVGDVVVSPDGKNVYAVSDSNGPATAFARHADSALTQLPGQAGCISVDGSGGDCLDGTGLGFPTGVVVSPDGANVYFVSPGHNTLTTFDRRSDGSLWQHGPASCFGATTLSGECLDARGLVGAVRAAISADGKTVYVASSGSSSPVVVPATLGVFSRDPETGVLTQLAGAAGCVASAPVDGCAVARGLGGVSDVVVSPDGLSVYAAGTNEDAVARFDVDPVDGSLSQPEGAAGCFSIDHETCTVEPSLDGASALAVDNDNVYVVSTFNQAISVFDRDGDGGLTRKPGAAGCLDLPDDTSATCAVAAVADPWQLELAADGRSLYAVGNDRILVLDRDAAGGLALKAAPDTCIADTDDVRCTLGRALFGALGVGSSPDGRSVYVGSRGSDAVAVFARVPSPACSNRLDDDGDGRVDHPGDPGCADSQDSSELDAPAAPVTPAPPTPHAPPAPPAPSQPVPPAPPTCLGERATLVAGPAQLRMTGTAGRDVIVGNGLDNVIDGRGGEDLICSLGGADRVAPGKGRDRVDAGAGADRVDLRDGARDTVTCGSGRRDRVYLDDADRARKCEVKRAG